MSRVRNMDIPRIQHLSARTREHARLPRTPSTVADLRKAIRCCATRTATPDIQLTA